jgi:hypothetical protein
MKLLVMQLPPPSQEITTKELVRFEVFTAVTMKNGIFWDATP